MSRHVSAFVLLATTFAAWGCYNPDYSSPGFYCHPTDDPACPDGQSCVNGRCVSDDQPVTVLPDFATHDMATAQCKTGGESCVAGGECCSQTCSAISGCVDQCRQDGTACSSATQCCSAVCNSNGSCGGGQTCSPDGDFCAFSTDCCSLVCSSGGICGGSSMCGQSGDFCFDDSECCSGFCDTFVTGGCF